MFLKASAFKQKIPEERKKEMVKPRESSELWANVENAAVFLAVFFPILLLVDRAINKANFTW